MAGFDRYIAVDWSARSAPSPANPSKDAIWIAMGGEAIYCRTREDAEQVLIALLGGKDRVLAGFDFAFAYPQWAMERLGGWRHAWALIERLHERQPDRFELAARLNELLGVPAFWGGRLSVRKVSKGIVEKRACERFEPRVQSPFKLWGAGSVGSQSLTGIPVLERLRRRFHAAVWPFESLSKARVVLAEVWPRLTGLGGGKILDERQVRGLVQRMPSWSLHVPRAWSGIAREEGWILGVPFGHEPPQVSERSRGRAAAEGAARKRA